MTFKSLYCKATINGQSFTTDQQRISIFCRFYDIILISNNPWTMFMLSSQYEFPSSFPLLLVGLQQNSDFLVSQKMYSTWVLLVKSAF